MGGKKVGDHYCIQREIGRGSFASVCFGIDKRTNQELAFKVIPVARLDEVLKGYLNQEIAVMRSIDSPYIVKLLDLIRTANNIYLVLELCRGGSIGDYLQTKGSIPLHLARRWLLQIVDAFITLSEQNIVHRDLKPENVLLSSQNEEEAVAKLADFGFTKVLDTNSFLLQTQLGSPLYMAPELFRDRMSDTRMDVWSFGVLANNMLNGPLFLNLQTIPQLIERQKTTQEDIACSNLSDDVKELLSCALRYDPTQRPTFRDIRNLRFFTEAPAPMVDIPLHPEQPSPDNQPTADPPVYPAVDYRQQVLTLSYRLNEELGKVAQVGVDLGNRKCGLAVIAVYTLYINEVDKCIAAAIQIQQSYTSPELENFIYEANARRLNGKQVIETWQRELSSLDLERSLIHFGTDMWIEPRVLKEAAEQLLREEAGTDRIERLRVALYLLHLGKDNERNRLEAFQQTGQSVGWTLVGNSWDQQMESLLAEVKAAEQYQA